METDERLCIVLGLAGLAVIALGFVLYVIDPLTVYIGVFVAGAVILGAGYFLAHYEHRRAEHRLDDMEAVERERAITIVLDDGYSKQDSGATITDLTSEE